jgi:hypothetical protein
MVRLFQQARLNIAVDMPLAIAGKPLGAPILPPSRRITENLHDFMIANRWGLGHSLLPWFGA